MLRTIALLALLAFVGGCGGGRERQRLEEELLEADRAFSSYAQEHGVSEAFDRYMDEDATLFRDGADPYVGRAAIRSLLEGGGGSLTWEPYAAVVAESGDLGYTLGDWVSVRTDSTGASSLSTGYYVTIWKRQQDGSWKYVFDSGVRGASGAAGQAAG